MLLFIQLRLACHRFRCLAVLRFRYCCKFDFLSMSFAAADQCCANVGFLCAMLAFFVVVWHLPSVGGDGDR
jgi:hypothetical protein